MPVEDLAEATPPAPIPIEDLAEAPPPAPRPDKPVVRKASSSPPTAPPPPTAHVAHVERRTLTPFKSAFSPKRFPHWD